MHYGLLPRANRGIFASTSCPTSPARSRWACSTSCRKATSRSRATRSGCARRAAGLLRQPEDYTARGKIITPLKDRIGPRSARTTRGRARSHGHHDAGGLGRQRAARRRVQVPRSCARSSRRSPSRRAAISEWTPVGRQPAAADQPRSKRRVERRAARAAERREPVVPRVSDVYARCRRSRARSSSSTRAS
jgi:magnesium chelatase subunit I